MNAKRILSKDFVAVDAEDTLSKLLGKMQMGGKKHNALVVKDKRFLGIINRKKMLQSKMRVDEEKVKKLVKRVSAVEQDDDEKAIARKMAFSDAHMLPVIDKERIPIGAVYALDIVKLLPELQMQRKLLAFEKKKMLKFRDNDSVGKVINAMRLACVDHAPVVDKTGKIMGVIAAFDIMKRYNMFPRRRPGGNRSKPAQKDSLEKEKTLIKLPVSNFASSAIVSAHRKDTVRKAIRLMEQNKVSDVIILNDFDEPTGIITMKDLIDLAALYL